MLFFLYYYYSYFCWPAKKKKRMSQSNKRKHDALYPNEWDGHCDRLWKTFKVHWYLFFYKKALLGVWPFWSIEHNGNILWNITFRINFVLFLIIGSFEVNLNKFIQYFITRVYYVKLYGCSSATYNYRMWNKIVCQLKVLTFLV